MAWALMALGIFYGPAACAVCVWRQPDGELSVVGSGAVTLRATGMKLVADKHWYEDRRFPIGSLMGSDQTTLSQAGPCTQLRELAGAMVDVVYTPPADAVPHGRGYRLKPHAVGVAIDIEFPSAQAHPAGLVLAQSGLSVTGGGVLLGSAFGAPIALRITLVKTAAFSGKGPTALVQLPGDLGRLRYYRAGNPNMKAMAENVLQLPAGYGASGQDYIGRALAPHCRFTGLGGHPPAHGVRVVRLAAVSQNDFHGPGAIDRSATTQPLAFHCEGSDHLEPVLYVDATYPLNQGAEGVGLPEAGSDIGVQVLFNDQPVRLGERSRALGWNPQLLPSTLADGNGGLVSPQGAYCPGPCAEDMAGPGWVSGGAAQGDNLGHDARLTLRYYQTGNQAPLPRAFAVPFTLTLEVQ